MNCSSVDSAEDEVPIYFMGDAKFNMIESRNDSLIGIVGSNGFTWLFLLYVFSQSIIKCNHYVKNLVHDELEQRKEN